MSRICIYFFLSITWVFFSCDSSNTAPEWSQDEICLEADKDSFIDSRDGKSYNTVKIGEYTWMAENLNLDTDGSECYENLDSNCDTYGRLYYWYTADTVCPSGWHLPSIEEWSDLIENMGGQDIAGNRLKALSGWEEAGDGSDVCGFSALPGGIFVPAGYKYEAYTGIWWSSTKTTEYGAADFWIYNSQSQVQQNNGDLDSQADAVRCIKD
jgi:uncharacterized protein (TIGR02145 family)